MAPEYSADRFFCRLLPVMLENHPEAASINGIIQFLIAGKPDRAYALNFLETPPSVHVGEHEAADLWIGIDEELVLPMIAGDLDVAAALKEDRLQISGEVELLAELSQLFSSQSWLELRTGESRTRGRHG